MKRTNKYKSKTYCNNIFTKQNKKLESACKKVESKLKNRNFRKKLIKGTVLFLLFNLVIILILSRKTIAYKLTKYFAKKILDGAGPQEKEMINQIQEHLPLVVEFINKHADTIKKIDNNYSYYSNIYNDFTNVINNTENSKNYSVPGGFPIKTSNKKMNDLPDRKLNEDEAKNLIDDLVEEKFFYFF